MSENLEEKKLLDYELFFDKFVKSFQNNYETIKIQETLPIFTYEFFVFQLFLPKQILKTIVNPILAFRFLDFPTQEIPGKISKTDDHIIFNQGKSSFFEMEIEDLKLLLKNEPLYIMLIDNNFGELKIIGTSRVDISIFAFDNFLNYNEVDKKPLARRNILKLFDNCATTICELDMSLLIRRELIKLDTNSNYVKPKQESKVTIQNPLVISDNLNLKDNELNPIDNLVSNTFINSKINPIIRNNYPPERHNLKSIDQVNNKSLNQNKKMIDKEINTYLNNYTENQVFLDPSNSKNFIDNLKNIIEGKSNPPSLFFHNKKNNYFENIEIKSCIEVNKTIENKEIKNETNQEIKYLEVKFKGNENRNFIKAPLPKDKEKKTKIEFKEKKVDNYDEKMKKIQRNNTNSSKNSGQKTLPNKEDKNRDSFIDAEISINEYEHLFNKINDKKSSNKANITRAIKYDINKNSKKTIKTKEIDMEIKKHQITESILSIYDENVITNEKQINIPSNKNNTPINLKEVSYNKEQFYEISQSNNFTISHNFASNDFKESSKFKRKSIDENLKITNTDKNEILKLQKRQSSIEESKNIIDMSSLVKNTTQDKKLEMEGEDEYKFEEYNNTNSYNYNSKEEIIEDKYSARKTNSLRKSLSLKNRSSSIKDLIDDEILISENNRKNNYIKCYICQGNVLKSEAVHHAENCKNIILSSIQESNIQSEANVFNEEDSGIKENIK